MTEGQFRQQIDFSWRQLKRLNLADYRVYFPDYAKVTVVSYRNLNYLDEWKKIVSNQLFDFQLTDHALLQFKRFKENGTEVFSYSYYENPFEILSYQDFLANHDLSITETGNIFIDYYNQYVATSGKQKSIVTPTRYDYAPNQYVEGRHPVSHMHFGHCSEIRIATKRILGPLSFSLFVLRQYYPASWQRFCSRPIPRQCAGSIRQNLTLIQRQFIKPNDYHEMILD